MTDRDESPEDDSTAPSRADTLAEAVADLGETPEDQLATVAERNDSLAERLPDDDLDSAVTGATAPASDSAPASDPAPSSDPAPGSPDQG